MNKPFIVRVIIYSIIFLTIFFYLIFKSKGIKEYLHIKNEYNEIVDANKKMEKEKRELKEKIQKLKNDKKFIEKVAREKYNMVKDGEIVIKINKKGGKK